jgi:hypothetical protein
MARTTQPRHDGGDPDASGTLSPEEQAEFDRLEAEEQAEPTEAELDRVGIPFGSEDPAPSRLDVQAATAPDVDPAAGIDTEAEATGQEVKTFATPWGLRPLKVSEAEDLRKQGLAITEEPDLEPDTSLDTERADLASLPVVKAIEHRDDEDPEA